MLAVAFANMLAQVRRQQAALAEQNGALQRTLSEQQSLLETIQALSTPLLPVGQGVVVLPIVGHVDAQRAAALLDTVLKGTTARSAHTVIVDLTGLAALDREVGAFLQRLIRATRLLGASVLLAGINAALARQIVAQGLDLGQASSYRDLQSAIDVTLRAQR